jgi:hypothetical protein
MKRKKDILVYCYTKPTRFVNINKIKV